MHRNAPTGGAGRLGFRTPLLSILALAAFALPGSAQAKTICVAPATGCDETQATVSLALTSASMSTQDDTIRLGAATYGATALTYNSAANSGADTIAGAGQGQTTLTAPAANNLQVLRVFGQPGAGRASTVQDLTVAIPDANVTNETGLLLAHATGRRVSVTGSTTASTIGVHLDDGALIASSVGLSTTPLGGNRGIYLDSPGTVIDSSVSAQIGVAASMGNAAGATQITRSRLGTVGVGLTVDSGTVNVDDSLIDLGNVAGGVGLRAENGNNSQSPMTINAEHTTVVGGGAGSIGLSISAGTAVGTQTATGTLADSVIGGPAAPIRRQAASGGAASVTTRYSAYDPALVTSTNTGTGSGAVTASTAPLTVAPGFVNPAGGDYHLTASSPLVDAGDPAAGGPPLDLATQARVTDGNGDGVARRDIGAYERPGVVPPAAGGAGAKPKPAVPVAPTPRLTGLKLSPASFRITKRTRGTNVRFALSETAKVRFSVQRRRAGRRSGRRCVAPTRANRSKRACVRWTGVKGSFTRAERAGGNAVRFRGRIGGKALTPGRYRLVVVATDTAGRKSAARYAGFTIVR